MCSKVPNRFNPLLMIYRGLVSPALHLLAGPGFGCRFEPTCSHYFSEAVELHGFYLGSAYGLKRLGRCHPWGASGYDPVPFRDLRAELISQKGQ